MSLDYDIAGSLLVGCLLALSGFEPGIVLPFSAPAATPAARQFGGDRIAARVHPGASRTDGGFVGPAVGVEALGSLSQAIALFRRSGAARNAVAQLCVPRTQPGSFGAPDRSPQQGVVVEDDGRRRCGRPGFAAGFFAAPLRPLARTAIARVGPWRRHGFTQQSVPVKRQIGMGVFERLAHFGVHGLAADLDVWRRPEQVQDAGACSALPGPVAVHHVGVFVTAFVADVSNERQNLPLFSGRLLRLCRRR